MIGSPMKRMVVTPSCFILAMSSVARWGIVAKSKTYVSRTRKPRSKNSCCSLAVSSKMGGSCSKWTTPVTRSSSWKDSSPAKIALFASSGAPRASAASSLRFTQAASVWRNCSGEGEVPQIKGACACMKLSGRAAPQPKQRIPLSASSSANAPLSSAGPPSTANGSYSLAMVSASARDATSSSAAPPASKSMISKRRPYVSVTDPYSSR